MNRTLWRITLLSSIGLIISAMLFGWWVSTGSAISSDASKFIAIGRLAGIVATVSVLLELFVMSRAPIVEKNFDLEEVNDFHRYNGYTMTYALLAHVVFLVMGYGVLSHMGWWDQLWGFTSQFEDVLKAIIGSVVFFAVAVVSLHVVRKRIPYEVWYFMHLLVYGGVLLAFGHQVHSGGDIVSQGWMQALWYGAYGLVFMVLGYYRFLRPALTFWRYSFRVTKVVEEADNVFSIYITGKNIENYRYDPGQYAHWRFISKELWLESHPFSFSSESGASFIRITFKSTSGDYTRLLRSVQPGTRVIIDGPRGSFTPDRAATDKVLLVAGGIGVAPFIASLKTFLRDGKQVQLIYSVTKRADLAFVDELRSLQQNPAFSLGITPYVSSEKGHITADSLTPYVRGTGDSLTVYVCGPDAMTAHLAKEVLPALGVAENKVNAERFTF